MQKRAIMLFGQPGAGKGTQANLLADKLGYYHFESSKVLENCFKSENPDKVFEIEGQKYKVSDEIERWKTGLLVSPPFVFVLFSKKIKELAGEGESIIFSGSPRTIYESERMMPLLKQLYGQENLKFVLIEVKAGTTIYRNSNRKICELMRHTILFTPETENLKKCPLDGSDLVKRKDLDDAETIKKRLEVFKEETFPVIESVEKQGIKINKISGEGSVSDVFEEILKVVK